MLNAKYQKTDKCQPSHAEYLSFEYWMALSIWPAEMEIDLWM